MKFRVKTTEDHKRYWKDRKIDWKKDYLSTWNHPHRFYITGILKQFGWHSLLEIGCGAGANLVNIIKAIPHKQLGGVDINPEAIEVCRETLNGAYLKVGSADDLPLSDNACDVILTDMCLIYFGPKKIHKALQEIKRVTRRYVIFCEFHHPSLWKRLKLFISSGYFAYDYQHLLEKHGFYDIIIKKFTPETWPGGNPQQDYGYFITARVLQRK